MHPKSRKGLKRDAEASAPMTLPADDAPQSTVNWSWVLSRSVIGLAALFALSIAAVPNCNCGQRRRHQESTARAVLRNVARAQQEMLASRQIDRNGDGVPEFGSFSELSRAALDADQSATDFGGVVDGTIVRNHYRIELWLPSIDGGYVNAERSGERFDVIDADRASREWRCYAWPAPQPEAGLHAPGGQRVYAIDADGTLVASYNSDPDSYQRLYRDERSPMPYVAEDPQTPDTLARDREGYNGQTWKVIP